MGLSMAMGAFLAGLMLAESEFSHQAYAEVRPIRDMLSGLFFISLGMLIDLGALVGLLPVVAGVTAAIIVLKAAIATGSLLVASSPTRVAIISGLAVAQVGEFSFILGRAGLDSGLLPGNMWQVLLGASVASMIVTPVLLNIAPAVATRLAGRAPARRDLEAGFHRCRSMIILGFGIGGRLVSRALRDLNVPCA